MSVIRRMFAERVTPDGDFGWTPGTGFGPLGGYDTPSGEKVNESTAMAISAWFAGINAISEDLGKLPFKTYRAHDDGSKELMRDHPVYRLMAREPNPEMSAQSFRETITQHALMFEGGYAEIERTRGGTPLALWPLDPTRVVKRRGTDGQLYYEVRNDVGGSVVLSGQDVFEIHGIGFDGLTGYRRAALARYTLGVMLAAQKYQSAFFGNGTWLGGFIQFPQGVGMEALKVFRDQLNARHKGADKAHTIGVIPEGGEYTAAVADPEKATLATLMNVSVEEVAGFLRMPLPKMMRLLNQKYDNLESLNSAYVEETLTPWGERMKQEAGRKLFGPNEQDMFCEYVFQALLMGDMAARTAYFQAMVKVGMTVNEVRKQENLPGIGPAGDVVFVDGTNLMPIDQAARKTWQEPTPQQPPEPPQDGAAAEAARPVIAEAARRVASKETAEIGKARTKHGDGEALRAWCDAWAHGSHSGYVGKAIATGVSLAARLTAGHDVDVDSTIKAIVAQYADIPSDHDGRESALVTIAMQHGIAAGLVAKAMEDKGDAS